MKSNLKILVILIGIVVAALCTYYSSGKPGLFHQSTQTSFLLKVEKSVDFSDRH